MFYQILSFFFLPTALSEFKQQLLLEVLQTLAFTHQADFREFTPMPTDSSRWWWLNLLNWLKMCWQRSTKILLHTAHIWAKDMHISRPNTIRYPTAGLVLLFRNTQRRLSKCLSETYFGAMQWMDRWMDTYESFSNKPKGSCADNIQCILTIYNVNSLFLQSRL